MFPSIFPRDVITSCLDDVHYIRRILMDSNPISFPIYLQLPDNPKQKHFSFKYIAHICQQVDPKAVLSI